MKKINKEKIIILGEDKFVKFMNMKFKDKLEILENKIYRDFIRSLIHIELSIYNEKTNPILKDLNGKEYKNNVENLDLNDSLFTDKVDFYNSIYKHEIKKELFYNYNNFYKSIIREKIPDLKEDEINKIMDRILNKVIYEWNSLSSIKQDIKETEEVEEL